MLGVQGVAGAQVTGVALLPVTGVTVKPSRRLTHPARRFSCRKAWLAIDSIVWPFTAGLAGAAVIPAFGTNWAVEVARLRRDEKA